VADLPERPSNSRTPVGFRLFVIGVVLVAAWFALGAVFSLARAAVALVGYVVVAVLAYWIGKFVGRSERRERDE
jgi:Flp pilus assembly protein TadB